jgi:hypothetical protein
MSKITHIGSYPITPAISFTVERINNVDVYRNADGTIIGFIDSALNRTLGRVMYRARNAANEVIAWGDLAATVKRKLVPAPRKAIGLYVGGACVVSFPAHLNAGRIPDVDDALAILAGGGTVCEVIAATVAAVPGDVVGAALSALDGRYIMWTDSRKHELLISETSPARLLAHWTGFVENSAATRPLNVLATIKHIAEQRSKVDLTKPELPQRHDPVVVDTRSNAEIFAAVTVKRLARVDLSKPDYVHPVLAVARDTRTFEEIMADCITTIRNVRASLWVSK